MTETLPSIIEAAWSDRSLLGDKSLSDAINSVMKSLDSGIIRICEFRENQWILNEWAKKAVLLSFAIRQSTVMSYSGLVAFDKVPLKCQDWSQQMFVEAGFRLVPGAIVRYGAYIDKNVVIMPSFVNIGSYIGDSSLIDSFATIGSCATVGRRCHISSGVVLAGVLEPLQAKPVILEDDVFVGANTTIAEGTLIESGSVIASGVTITASTKIYYRESKEILYGRIPSGSVVVSGIIPGSDTMSAIIVKRVDMYTRKQIGLNSLLRDFV